MAYASFRCLVDAPYPKVWQTLCETAAQVSILGEMLEPAQPSCSRQPASLDDMRLRQLFREETMHIDADKGEISFRLERNQTLCGERRFAIREDRASSKYMIEALLDWRAGDQNLDRDLHGILDTLVRDSVLRVKERSEA